MIKYILSVLMLGVIVGYANGNWGSVVAGSFMNDYVFGFSLILLIFVMGLVFGLDREAMAKLKKRGLRVLIVPLAVALGSVLGGIAAGLVLGIDIVSCAAVCSGFGWYTLAGPLINQLLGPKFGMLGFAVNFLRELLTIVTISIVVKVDRYAPVAFGGATTMDTTLPVIVRYCGSDTLITAFSSGFTLSMAAPFTISALASLR